MGQQWPHSPHSKTKANYKSTNLRITSGISDAATASVNSEKTRMKKLMMMMKMIIILLVIVISRFHGV